MKTNRALLILVVLLLAAILGVLVYQMNQPKTTADKIEDALNSAADDVGDALDELGEDVQKEAN